VLRLRVSLETALTRNRERFKRLKEGDQYVEARHTQVPEWSRAEPVSTHDIDTDQTLPETILAVKRAVWESL